MKQRDHQPIARLEDVAMLTSIRQPRTILAAAALCAGLAFGLPAAPAAAADYSTTRVTAFNWVAGQSQWQQSNINRLARSQWRFLNNGYFAMVQPDGYPLVAGSWTRRGALTTFSGRYVFNTGYSGQTIVDVVGSLRGRVLSLRYVSAQTLAAVIGCDVNGDGCNRYGSSRTKAYTARVTVRRFA